MRLSSALLFLAGTLISYSERVSAFEAEDDELDGFDEICSGSNFHALDVPSAPDEVSVQGAGAEEVSHHDGALTCMLFFLRICWFPRTCIVLTRPPRLHCVSAGFPLRHVFSQAEGKFKARCKLTYLANKQGGAKSKKSVSVHIDKTTFSAEDLEALKVQCPEFCRPN
jgi:hypothetical protein